MKSILPTKQKIDDLVDGVWRDDFPLPFRAPVFGLRKFLMTLETAIEETSNSPFESLHSDLEGVFEEVDRLLDIVCMRAYQSEDQEEENGDELDEDSSSETLFEMAEGLEGWIDEVCEIDDSGLSESQIDEVEQLTDEVRNEGFRVIGILKGADNCHQELGHK